MDLHKCEDVRNWNDLCGGIFDLENVFIDVTPSFSEINVDDTKLLSATFVGPPCKKVIQGEEVEKFTYS